MTIDCTLSYKAEMATEHLPGGPPLSNALAPQDQALVDPALKLSAATLPGKAPASKGLEGIVATSSSICWIDGDAGVLSYRGIDIHKLAQHSSFEETAFLLWHARLPNRAQLNNFTTELAAARILHPAIIQFLREVPSAATPMQVLRTAVSYLSIYDEDEQDSSHPANLRKSFRVTAQIAMVVAIFDRIRKGKEVVEPDLSLSHAANFLWMLNGEKPSETATKAFDIALILHADHELNASTFAARVIAATLADFHSAMTGAIGALKGPLHGGANEATMKLLFAIDAAGADPAEYVRTMFANKEKISGFGHRVYHTEDPRATHLRRMSEELGTAAGDTKWFDMSQKIEGFVKSEKKLNANVDFYSASTYTTLGIDVDLFTPIFAISRIAGWAAHVLEQHDDNRLIRPRAEYTGPHYPEPYVLLQDR